MNDVPAVDKQAKLAAVLIALTRHESDPQVVLTKRAEHLNTHRGEVAFPGGKWEYGDRHLLDTALRETREEIDLPADKVELLAQLPARTTRHGIRVTPFVGTIAEHQRFCPDPRELDAVFTVPLSFLLRPDNLITGRFVGHDYDVVMPCFIFEGYRIWGFSLQLLADFFYHGLGVSLPVHKTRVDQ